MLVRVHHTWDRLRSTFWFVPTLMAVGAIVASYATVALDAALTEAWLRQLSWVYTGGAEGASTVLGTIAGSMITIAGVVFSITLVALSLASSQFGPRLLRNFMRDTTNQIVLGTFVATFLYCLFVLRTIRHEESREFVPHVSVTCGILLAVASLGVLIYFIHHVSVSIQADELIARVCGDLTQAIDRLFPEKIGRGPTTTSLEKDQQTISQAFQSTSQPVLATGDGYLQAIDANSLMTLAREKNLCLWVQRRPGHYIIAGMPLVQVNTNEPVSEELTSQINAAFLLGNVRTPTQDVEYAISQLVEIAVRALSPGINDPFTAITCVDRLGSALCSLAQRELPSPYRLDEDNHLRVIAVPVDFSATLDAAFNQIRQYGRGSAAVTMRLLETIAQIGSLAHRPDDLAALRRHAEMIVRGAQEGLSEPEDRRGVEQRYQMVLENLQQGVKV